MKTKEKTKQRWTPLKIDLLVNGLEDGLEEKEFPPEGRFSGEINFKAIHPIPEKSFTLGFTVEMSESPQLFVDLENISPYDIIQGEAGDCYLLAPCSALSMKPKLLEKLIPSGQTIDKIDPQYTGMVQIRFWQFGRWKEVFIDDWLPTKNGETPLYGRSSHADEFWPALLEKAYAKMHGSYEAICGGFNANSLVDLTGGMTYHHDLSKYSPKQLKDFFYTIMRGLQHESFMCCGMEEKFNPITTKGVNDLDGLVINHAYAITGTTEIRLKNGKFEKLVRLKNPWDEETEWEKEWSNKSVNCIKWKNVRKRTLRNLKQQITNDEECWLMYDDFLKYFCKVTICTLGIESDIVDKVQQGRWQSSTLKGFWKRGFNAGGSGNNIFKYASNPQYMIQLQLDLTADNSLAINKKALSQCLFQIGLMQEYRKTEENLELPMLGLGIRVYKIKKRKSDKLNRKYLASPSNVALQTEIYKQQREVCLTGKLDPGYYVIVPSTFYPNEETSYLLRIFTENEIKIKEL